MAKGIAAPMPRDEFLLRVSELDRKSGEWVHAWLVGWFMEDLTDQQRGDAYREVEHLASAVHNISSGPSSGRGSSPLMP